ncbi:MAG: hypothetical protein ACTHJM_15855 [Marmoricola sp.]
MSTMYRVVRSAVRLTVMCIALTVMAVSVLGTVFLGLTILQGVFK